MWKNWIFFSFENNGIINIHFNQPPSSSSTFHECFNESFHVFIIGEDKKLTGQKDLKFIKMMRPKRRNNEESPSQVSSQNRWVSSFATFLSVFYDNEGLHLIDITSGSPQWIASKFYEENLFAHGSIATSLFKLVDLVELVKSTNETAACFTTLGLEILFLEYVVKDKELAKKLLSTMQWKLTNHTCFVKIHW